MGHNGSFSHDLAPGDIHRLVGALLDSIRRGELEASPREVDFLHSVVDLLEPAEGQPEERRPTADLS